MAEIERLTITLPREMAAIVKGAVDAGDYASSSEVVRAGLRMLEDFELTRAERAARLAREINTAFDDPASDVPAEQVFAKLEQQFKADKSARSHGA